MAFSDSIREEALVRARRTCCVCHEFAGVYTNVHHIIPEADGGPNSIDNAVVLCLRCHGEVGHYNVRHPIGNKYSPDEVRRHRDAWWNWCAVNPAVTPPKWPVSVAPSKSRLFAEGWSQKCTLNISNKVETTLFDVAIKMTFELVSMTIDDLLIRDIAFPRQVVGSVGEMEVGGDAFMMSGVDENGLDGVILFLRSMSPRSGVAFEVCVHESHIAVIPPNAKASASFNAVSFGSEPTGAFMQSKDAIAYKLVCPVDGFRIKGISFFVIKARR